MGLAVFLGALVGVANRADAMDALLAADLFGPPGPSWAAAPIGEDSQPVALPTPAEAPARRRAGMTGFLQGATIGFLLGGFLGILANGAVIEVQGSGMIRTRE